MDTEIVMDCCYKPQRWQWFIQIGILVYKFPKLNKAIMGIYRHVVTKKQVPCQNTGIVVL